MPCSASARKQTMRRGAKAQKRVDPCVLSPDDVASSRMLQEGLHVQVCCYVVAFIQARTSFATADFRVFTSFASPFCADDQPRQQTRVLGLRAPGAFGLRRSVRRHVMRESLLR